MGDGSKVATVLTCLRGMQFDLLPNKPRKKAIGGELSLQGEEDLEESKTLAELWVNQRKCRGLSLRGKVDPRKES